MIYPIDLKSSFDFIEDKNYIPMQYIGKKNDIHFYEGDIIEYKYKWFSYGEWYISKGFVSWDDYRNSWSLFKLVDGKTFRQFALSDFWIDFQFNYGNIYESKINKFLFDVYKFNETQN